MGIIDLNKNNKKKYNSFLRTCPGHASVGILCEIDLKKNKKQKKYSSGNPMGSID